MIPRHRPPFGVGRVILAILNCLKKVDVEQVESKFAETFKVPYVVLLPSVRAGISWALRASIDPGTPVLCPVYTCDVVHEAVVRADAKLHLIDTQENGFLMEQAKLSSAQTGNYPIVLCEIYGYTYNLSAVTQQTQNTPSIRIVDMAMTVPNSELTKRLQENDVGFLSFGIGKCMYSGWGGMCFTKNKALANEIRKIRDLSLKQNNLLVSFKRSLNILLRTLAHEQVLYGFSRRAKEIGSRIKSRNRYKKKNDCMLPWKSSERLSPEWFLPSTRLDRNLICYNLKCAKYYFNRRISLASRYQHNLVGVTGLILPEASNFPLSHYTIRVNSGIRCCLREYLWKRSIDVGMLFPFPKYVPEDDYPNASKIAAEVVNLPLDPCLTFDDVDWICENLTEFSKKRGEPMKNHKDSSGYNLHLRCTICGEQLKGKPLCTSSFTPRTGKGHKVSALSHLWQCPKCRFIFRDCEYSCSNIEKHFDSADYVASANEQLYRRLKGKMFEHLANQTTKYFDFCRRRRLLVDFGCSYGHLGQAFQAAGWDVIGVDIAPSVLEYHQKHGTFPVYHSLDTTEIPDGSVDAIAMMDVICYLENPIKILELAYKKLANPGVLLFRVPNRTHFIRSAASLQKVLPINIVRRFECDHKGYWSTKTFKLAAQKVGFDMVCINRREKGYWYPWPRKILHWTTQLLSHLTCGAIDMSMVFHAQMWKGHPKSAKKN